MVPNDQPTEASPLLADATHSPDTTVRPSDYAPRDISWRKSWLKWYPFVAAALLVLMADVPAYMAEVAKLRVFEDAVCRRYYQDADPDLGGDIGSIPEHLCKLPEIQSRLAQMKGLLSFVDGAPGLLLAIPFGILADRLGHRPIIGLAVIGCTLHDLWLLVVFWFHNVFPINAIYAAPGFFLVGGGSVVLSSISLSMIAAAVPQALRCVVQMTDCVPCLWNDD